MKQIVLSNQKGEIARVYDASSFASGEVVFVRNHRTCRIDPIDSTRLEVGKVEVLHRCAVSELEKQPLRLQTGAQFQLRLASGDLEKSAQLKDDDDKKEILVVGKWVSIIQILGLALIFLIGAWLGHEAEQKPEETAIRMVEIEKEKVKPVVAKPLKQAKVVERQRPVVAKVVKIKKNPPPPQKIVTHGAPKSQHQKATAQAPESSIENLGALGALGGMSKKMQQGGGLNLDGSSLARGGGRGTGGGGVGAAGSGGIANALYGKGLVAGSPGSGAQAGSAGGYGTRGTGGGRQGYGNNKIVGSSGGSVAPLETESFIEGGLTREQVEEVIRRNMGQMTLCYEKGLQIEPSLGGRVSVSFTIGAQGQVTVARVQHSSVNSKQLESCVVGRVKNYQFPKPVAGVNVQVNYPFSFNRQAVN